MASRIKTKKKMARAAVIPPSSPQKRTTRGKKSTNITTAARKATEESSSTGPKPRGRPPKTQGTTAGTTESTKRSTRSKTSKKADVESDQEGTDDDEIGLISTNAKTARGKSSSSKTTSRGSRGAAAAAEKDDENDDDELAQTDAPKKKQVGRPRTKNVAAKDSAPSNSETGVKPTRGRPRGTTTKSNATSEPEKSTATRKKTRAHTDADDASSSASNPRRVVVTTHSSVVVKSNLLRGPAKKKTVTFKDISDSEKEDSDFPESVPVGRRRTTRQTGLNAKPARKQPTISGAGPGRGRKPAATTNQDAPKPLSPKKAKQVAKSLSSYASSDGEDDELSCAKNQDQAQIKLIADSPIKYKSEVPTSLSSPVKRINLNRHGEESALGLSASKQAPGNTTGLSSPVRRINFTASHQGPMSVDENGDVVPVSKPPVDFKDSVFMFSPAKRPPPSPFHYTLRETPRKCPLTIKDQSKTSSQPDFTPKHNSPLKSSPRKADLSASFLQSPIESSSTPFSARTRLFQSPAKRFLSPFKGSISPEKIFGSQLVERASSVNSSPSPVRDNMEPEAQYTPRHEITDSTAGIIEGDKHEQEVEMESEPEGEDEVQFQAPVEDETIKVDREPSMGIRQESDYSENADDEMEINDSSDEIQDQRRTLVEDKMTEIDGESGMEASQNIIEEDGHGDMELNEILDEVQDDEQETVEPEMGEISPDLMSQNRRDDVRSTEYVHMRSDCEDFRAREASPTERHREQEDGVGDVQADSEVEDTQKVPDASPDWEGFETGEYQTEQPGIDSEIQYHRLETYPENEPTQDPDDVFVDRPITAAEESFDSPAQEHQTPLDEIPNDENDEDDTISDAGVFDFGDDPTLVAPAGDEMYTMATPSRLCPYEIDEPESTTQIRTVRYIPPPAPSPPIRTSTRPFEFQPQQGGNSHVESGTENADRRATMDRSGSPTPLEHRTPGSGQSIQEQPVSRENSPSRSPLAEHPSGSSETHYQTGHPRRRGVHSLSTAELRARNYPSRRSLRSSRGYSDVSRRSLVASRGSLPAKLPLREVSQLDSASPVEESGSVRNNLSAREDYSSTDEHLENNIICDREPCIEPMGSVAGESDTQPAKGVFNDPEPRTSELSHDNVDIYCDENDPPVQQGDDLAYPDLTATDEYDDNKENENVNTSPPPHPALSENAELDENKENEVACISIPPVTPLKKKGSPLLHTSYTVSKVPLKPEGQVSPLKLPRKRVKSLSNTSPRRSSPRLRNRVLLPKSPAAPSFSPRKSIKLQEDPRSSPRKSLGARETVHEVVSSGNRGNTTSPCPVYTPSRNTGAGSQVLRGAVVFVDVHTTEGEDASGIFVELLQQMGARCVKTWSWNPRLSLSPMDGVDPKDNKVGITHVVYKDGGVRTLEKVRQAAGLVKCVGVGWVLEYVFFLSFHFSLCEHISSVLTFLFQL